MVSWVLTADNRHSLSCLAWSGRGRGRCDDGGNRNWASKGNSHGSHGDGGASRARCGRGDGGGWWEEEEWKLYSLAVATKMRSDQLEI